MTKLTPTNYRVIKFYNSTTNEILFGIAAKVEGKWHNCRFAHKWKDNFFAERKDANKKRQDLKAGITSKPENQ